MVSVSSNGVFLNWKTCFVFLVNCSNSLKSFDPINSGDGGVMPDRVVVTGMGTVNPLGLTLSETWKNAINGVSGDSAPASVRAQWQHGGYSDVLLTDVTPGGAAHYFWFDN